MDLQKVWFLSEQLSKLCNVVNSLEDDPNYSKTHAVNDLTPMIEKILDEMGGESK